jgi:hypothetical protein
MPQSKTVFIPLTGKEFISIVSGPICSVESNIKGKGHYGAAIDGLESLLLALAAEGVDLGTPQVENAVKNAVESIANNLS